ncbi:MAG: CocE/NonD family hydrolase [Gemmatimonadetes bacterium]|nr:CocE/NonD family hydrolase [Gemmatimonadota bacterium]
MLLLLAALALFPAPADSLYDYRTERGFITLPDGARLAATWWRPVPKHAGERFPALLEFLPYRKDDSFYARDFPLYDYFARRGLLLVKVDIRGTGGSAGRVPEREYSEQELDDAVALIAALARDSSSNGSVGMWGISWGGFNAIQVALRQPPALKAILALHASDDLFHDDVHYIDGALHLDPYILQIDHENALPRTPAYPLDSAYFRDRFEAYPWVLTYLKQPVDGPFWRKNGLRYRPDDLSIPAYFIGGLLDGYRDTPIRALEYLKGTVKVEIGPWVHDWPDDGTPGPNYEWRARAVAWWNHWLRGAPSPIVDEPRLLVFEREGAPPDRNLEQAPGRWRFEDWPVHGARRDTLFLAPEFRLARRLISADDAPPHSCAEPARPAAPVRLAYRPGFGVMAGDWWGEPTGDMRRDDAGSLVFDSPVLDSSLTLIGLPAVRITTIAGAPLANWTARLEDVAPNGEVALVAGGVLNATQHLSRTTPERLVPGRRYTLDWDLHFTTWTYRPGHRIRLALANAQFPMLWPTPYPMESAVELAGSHLVLPVVPGRSAYPPPVLPAPEPRRYRSDVTDRDAPPSVERTSYEPRTGVTSFEWSSYANWDIGRVRFDYTERELYTTTDRDPARSTFLGEASHRIRPPGRDFTLQTRIDIRSDSTAFHVTVTRTLTSAGKRVRQKVWTEAVPREFH